MDSESGTRHLGLDYFREHISLGYATVHSALGITADTSLAVLREDANRSQLYVAMPADATPTSSISTDAALKQTNSATATPPQFKSPDGVTLGKPPSSFTAYWPTTNGPPRPTIMRRGARARHYPLSMTSSTCARSHRLPARQLSSVEGLTQEQGRSADER